MESRIQIPFNLQNTYTGWAYLNSSWGYGLFRFAQIASYFTPMQIASQTFGYFAPTLANYSGNENIKSSTHFIANGLALIANWHSNALPFIVTYSANYISDQMLEYQWGQLTEEQQSAQVWQEFFAMLHVVKIEAAKKMGKKLDDLMKDDLAANNAANNNAANNNELDKLKENAERKQQDAKNAAQEAKGLRDKQTASNRKIADLVKEETSKKVSGSKPVRPYVLHKNKVEVDNEQAKKTLQEGGAIKFYAHKKHGREGDYSNTYSEKGRAELNQQVNNANNRATTTQQEAVAAQERLVAYQQQQQAQEQEAMRRAQEQARQEEVRRAEEQARQEEVRRAEEQARQEAMRRAEEQARQEAMRRAQEQARQEAMRRAQEQARQEAMRRAQEQARQEAMRRAQEQARQEEVRRAEEQARREEVRRAEEQARQETVRVEVRKKREHAYIEYKEKATNSSFPEKKMTMQQPSNQNLSSHGLFSSSLVDLNRQARRPGEQTLGDSLKIALEIKENGGDKDAQLAAQNMNRYRF